MGIEGMGCNRRSFSSWTEGDYGQSGCDPQLAAIRNTADRKHMIALALTAFATKNPRVTVVLNPDDRYYGNRCTIERITAE